MKIIDTNGLNYMLKHKISSGDLLSITPDIRDEFEVEHEGRLPQNVADVTQSDSFDGADFLRHYKAMLNKYKGRSFYNMTGMGDISILALLSTEKEANKNCLPSMVPETTVITSDDKLAKKIKKEFSDTKNEFDTKIVVITPEKHFGK